MIAPATQTATPVMSTLPSLEEQCRGRSLGLCGGAGGADDHVTRLVLASTRWVWLGDRRPGAVGVGLERSLPPAVGECSRAPGFLILGLEGRGCCSDGVRCDVLVRCLLVLVLVHLPDNSSRRGWRREQCRRESREDLFRYASDVGRLEENALAALLGQVRDLHFFTSDLCCFSVFRNS